jgi:hypothetical protein
MDLWQCPRCGEWFITANMPHSCGKFSLEELFAHSDPQVFQLFRRFEELVRALGPVRMIPQKSRVVFQVRVRFAGAVPRKSYLQCGFGFHRRREHPRFYKIEQYAPRWFHHYTRVEREEDFDDEFRDWIREAYAVGRQDEFNSE